MPSRLLLLETGCRALLQPVILAFVFLATQTQVGYGAPGDSGRCLPEIFRWTIFHYKLSNDVTSLEYNGRTYNEGDLSSARAQVVSLAYERKI